MKFSESWLHEWIHPSIDNTTLIDRITMSGLKVNILEPVSEDFSGVIIGNIVNIEVNPYDSDSYINTVDIGNGCLLNIVSESKKCKINLRVAVALIGAKLPGNLQIKYIKKLGSWSEGMLCSFSSLGIIYNNDTNDIIELPTNAPIGGDFRNYLQLNDNIIDITITPNRGDCLNLMGIAHDIAAIYRLPSISPKIDYVVSKINDVLSISIENPNACPCYISRILRNVNLSIPTPLWMKEKLRRCGVQIINVAIDITNYVLLELGYPIHIFDLDKICGGINVRFSNKGEKISLSYSQNEIILSEGTLIIADHIQPLEIAGILVGNNCVIDVLKTSNIFLEAAFFNPLDVVKSVKQYGINTYSSYRYERYGINPNISRLALERVTYLLINICGGLPGEVSNIIYENMLPKQTVIILRKLKLIRLLGCVIHDNEVVDILVYLGCKVKYEKVNNSWKVTVPIWRFDIKIEEDLIEEVIRLYGYDKMIGTSVFTKFSVIKKKFKNIRSSSLSRTKNLLVDLGYQEVITYSFVDSDTQSLLYPNTQSILLLNPLTLDMSALRLSLWIGLLKVMVYNQNRQQKNIRLFECGKCFVPRKKKNVDKIHQHLMLSGMITGSRFDEHWDISSDMLNFYDIKGDVEALLEINGNLNNIKFKPQTHTALQPGQTASIFLNENYIGVVGVIHPVLEKKLNLRARTFVFELFWDRISDNKISSKKFNIPKYPINRRDISIIVNKDISAGDIIFECKRVMREKLIDIKLFDVYYGSGIPKGFKSLSISLYIYDCSHTLNENEIQSIITKCISVLQGRFQISFRKK